MAERNGILIARFLAAVMNTIRLKGDSTGLSLRRIAGTITALMCLVVGVSAYAIFYAPIMFLTNNLVWNLLSALFTFAGVMMVLMPVPDKPLSLIVGKKKWWMVLAYADLLLVMASPFIALPLVGFYEGLTLLLFVIINCGLLLGLLLIGLVVCDLMAQGWRRIPASSGKRP